MPKTKILKISVWFFSFKVACIPTEMTILFIIFSTSMPIISHAPQIVSALITVALFSASLIVGIFSFRKIYPYLLTVFQVGK